ncbi:MarR family winged helix-turn-helix transcriptional regulator [Pseudalkalibacillus sp. A8]|uniref:MarR family winged helix-turn-helix transcriptional regulator n=1 Tax=Pseudalkalibacillus sp. A8 TaxID=3382641 RepID=UPI0038B44437
MNLNEETLNKHWTDIYFMLHYPHEEKITHQVIRILQLVEKREKVGINSIASYFNVSHNTASENVKRIIAKKYLKKRRDPEDDRRVILNITTLGKEVLYRNTSLDYDKLKSIINNMSSDEQLLVKNAFELLKKRAENVHFS